MPSAHRGLDKTKTCSPGAREHGTQANASATNESGDRFGNSLAVGDFDDDGCDDLAVGVPYEGWVSTSYAGVVSLAYGTSSGISTWTGFNQTAVSGALESSDMFGYTLVTGDFDDDAELRRDLRDLRGCTRPPAVSEHIRPVPIVDGVPVHRSSSPARQNTVATRTRRSAARSARPMAPTIYRRMSPPA